MMILSRKQRRINRNHCHTEAGRLRAEILHTMHTIDAARNHFEQEINPTLIDCYIYELNAAQLRYQFLIQQMKRYQEEKPYEHMVRKERVLPHVSLRHDRVPQTE